MPTFYELFKKFCYALSGGVSVKSWNIVIIDDKLEENEEIFEVLLASPINVVLGAKAKTLIKIIDGGKDHCSVTFTNDTSEENPPDRGRLASGPSTLLNLKSNNGLVEGMAVTNLNEDVKESEGDVMQQFPLKLPSKKKLMVVSFVAYRMQMLYEMVSKSTLGLTDVEETILGAADTVDEVGRCVGEPLSDTKGLLWALNGGEVG
eukprot:g37736.t1